MPTTFRRLLSTAVIGAAFMLSAIAAAESAPAAGPPPSAAASSRRYPLQLKDLQLVGIGRVGDDVAVLIEMPVRTTERNGARLRRLFHKGSRISGSGYVIAGVGDRSVILERDGSVDTLLLSCGGDESAAAEDAAFRQQFHATVRGVRDFARTYEMIPPAQREQARQDLARAQIFLAEARQSGRGTMADAGEAVLKKAGDACMLTEQADNARQSGNSSREAVLRTAAQNSLGELRDLYHAARALSE